MDLKGTASQDGLNDFIGAPWQKRSSNIFRFNVHIGSQSSKKVACPRSQRLSGQFHITNYYICNYNKT